LAALISVCRNRDRIGDPLALAAIGWIVTGVCAAVCRPLVAAVAGASCLQRYPEVVAMTGETIRDLLTPLIGKSGSISMLVSRIGQVGFGAADSRKLTGVEVRPDGLVRLERETGWTVIDPGEVVAVVWNDDTDSSPGQFL
jgi:hypothetical protein